MSRRKLSSYRPADLHEWAFLIAVGLVLGFIFF